MIKKFRTYDEETKSFLYFDFLQNPIYWVSKLKNDPINQSIGLFDKNGVEIYEGDLLKLNDKGIYKVKFNNKYLCYMFYLYDFLRLPEDNKDIPITWHSQYEIEVIGNVYENSDLLTN